MKRQDFLLQPYTQTDGNIIYDFPLDDYYINGVIQPTKYGDSDNQHILDIIINNIGAIKQFPLLGFGLFKYQNAEFNLESVFNSLSKNMKSDGYTVLTGAVIPKEQGFEIDTDLINPSY